MQTSCPQAPRPRSGRQYVGWSSQRYLTCPSIMASKLCLLSSADRVLPIYRRVWIGLHCCEYRRFSPVLSSLRELSRALGKSRHMMRETSSYVRQMPLLLIRIEASSSSIAAETPLSVLLRTSEKVGSSRSSNILRYPT